MRETRPTDGAAALRLAFALVRTVAACALAACAAARAGDVAGAPSPARDTAAAPPGAAARSGAAPAATGTPLALGRFDPERPAATLRRRPSGTALPDSVGKLLPREIEAPTARGDIRSYLLYLPPGLGERAGAWPLILYLHGRSLRGGDLEMVKRYGLPSFLARGWDVPFVVVAPQLPAGRYWDDPEQLVGLVEQVAARYPVDRDRTYLTGFSLGAGGVWEVLGSRADAFAAAVPISAWTPSPGEGWIEALDGLPLRIYHGTEDRPAPYDRTSVMVRYLERAGLDVELVTFRGEGHGIVQAVYGDPDLYWWMLIHRR